LAALRFGAAFFRFAGLRFAAFFLFAIVASLPEMRYFAAPLNFLLSQVNSGVVAKERNTFLFSSVVFSCLCVSFSSDNELN